MQRIGDMGAVIAGKPDLVHAIVEADDAVLGHDLAHVVHDPLRRRRVAAFLRSVGNFGQDSLAQHQKCTRVRQLAFEAVGKQSKAWSNIPHHLSMQVEYLLDRRRQIAHMQHGRPLRPHQERRLFHRVVTE